MGKIIIHLKSQSIGDTIASVPYISRFQETNSADEVYASINDYLIQYFTLKYPNIIFLGRDYNIGPARTIYLEYSIGSSLSQSLSIQQVYATQLGFTDAIYIRPEILFPEIPRRIKAKYITIGVHSTAQLKYWNHPSGKRVQHLSMNWNILCGMIRKAGYTPVVVEKDKLFGKPPYFNGLPSKANIKVGQNLTESMNLVYHSEFYIGLSSGMSWVAHAMGKPVAMISNFTEDWNEFDLATPDYIRITNKNSCHGCFNSATEGPKFNKDDWYSCPKHEGTERQFECHTSITPEQVFDKIKHWLV